VAPPSPTGRLWNSCKNLIQLVNPEMAKPIKRVLAKHCRRVLLSAIFLCLLLVSVGAAPMGKGLLLGSLFSIANFVLMAHFLPLAVTTDTRRRRLLTSGSLVLRHAILAIPLVVATTSRQFHLVATVIGIFSVQLAILAELPFKRTAAH
jgi:hypothetical protein